MTVTCPDCRSIFRVDPEKVPATGVRARCSVCGGVITIAGGTLPVSVTPASSGVVLPAFARSAAGGGRSASTPVGGGVEQTWQASAPVPTPHTNAPPHVRSIVEQPLVHRGTPTPAVRDTGPSGGHAIRPFAAPPNTPRSTPVFTPTAVAPANRTPATGVPALDAPAVTVAEFMPLAAIVPAPTSMPVFPPVAWPNDAARVAVPNRASEVATTAPSLTPHVPHVEPTTTAPRRSINPFLNADPGQRARRLARALVSDLVAYHPQRREDGLRDGTLRQLFREEIKKSYEEYVEQVGREMAESTPHFQEALNELLGGGRKLF